MNLESKIKKLIEIEGGDKYTNNPSDPGGPTRWGITEVVARAFGYTGDMKELPYEMAFSIYTKRYWYRPNFHKINEISEQLASICFDWGVNSGQTLPVKALQRCLNVLNNEMKLYKDIKADGNLGEITLYCLKMFIEKRGNEGLNVLIKMVNSLRLVFYIEIAEKNKTQGRFEYGWQRRTFFE